MVLKLQKLDLPAAWASYLINGDSSGLERSDVIECDATLATEFAGMSRYCVECSEEPFIGRYDGLQTELLTYTFDVRPLK